MLGASAEGVPASEGVVSREEGDSEGGGPIYGMRRLLPFRSRSSVRVG